MQQQQMRKPRESPVLTVLFLLAFLHPLLCSALDQLPTGSSISFEDHNTSFLLSPDASFAAGFYEVGINAFTFAVWFKNSADNTIAWAANRDRPVNGHGSRLTLRRDGSFTLTDFDGTVAWSSNTTGSAVQVELLDSGNLVVVTNNGSYLWQSFDSPTDTLLPTQPMTRSTPLVSNSYHGSIFSGFYRFYFDTDNVVRLIFDEPEISSIYWPDPFNTVWENDRTSYNRTRFGMLDELGHFSASDQLIFNASDYGRGVARRLTLDYDGNLRLYSLSKESGAWSVTWQALQGACDIHGSCGLNAICAYGTKLECTCPPGFELKC